MKGEAMSKMIKMIYSISANLFDSINFTRVQVEALVNLPKPTFTCMVITVQQ